MSSRETILATIRRSLGANAGDRTRAATVASRLAEAPKGLIPARGQLPDDKRIQLFARMLEDVSATVERVADAGDVPQRLAKFLKGHNLPPQIVRGEDALLAGLPWDKAKTLEVKVGRADGSETVGLSRAFGGVAETGTLMLASGPENPTTVNFLPEVHVVAIRAEDIAGDYETVFARLRKAYGKGKMPRTFNLVTGASRSADIEQTLLLGAHGPRRLHVMIVG
ncbi:MAG: lactate utilization protein [Rhodobiaceae bacterium]|nr:lactate utilization protein [Rhodobiaceae bacterium]MCC0015833.1 lactate utilization protein [Rhodobiaceae bacterium]MCC0040618.1 lactate utilization protein [Rhodobiaceae bacterium]MCC0054091.1 lactate utilization protein [Rhodobiaceae bacterium]